MTTARNMFGLLPPFLLAASTAFAGEMPLGLDSDLHTLAEGNNRFAVSLYSILKQEEGNLFFSPYSISSALAMTYGGARQETAGEMAEALGFTLGPDKTHPGFARLASLFNSTEKTGEVQLSIANSLWPQKHYPFLPTYLQLIKEHYGVSITPLDYVQAAEEARGTINTWVEERTQAKIRDLIPAGELTPETTLVLVNAIYFKGNWASQFDPAQTADARFTLPDGSTTQVSMMRQSGRFGYEESEGAQFLELPYAGGELSMLIILPDSPGKLPELENQFTAGKLSELMELPAQGEVDVSLPKFKINWGTFDLKPPLQALGMRKAFQPGADFSGMDGSNNLFIDAVFHKAFIEVNEAGTEAAAATAVSKVRGVSQRHSFNADHPFLFLIRELTTGSTLFLGRVVDPGKEDS